MPGLLRSTDCICFVVLLLLLLLLLRINARDHFALTRAAKQSVKRKGSPRYVTLAFRCPAWAPVPSPSPPEGAVSANKRPNSLFWATATNYFRVVSLQINWAGR